MEAQRALQQQGKNLWDQTRERLRKILDEHNYKNWFSQTRFHAYQDGCLTVAVPSPFFADWMENHYLDVVRDCANEIDPAIEQVRFLATSDAVPMMEDKPAPKAPKTPDTARGIPRLDGFNPRYVFDRFVVGAGNRFAHAASKAVAENPSRAYNPLFLYGGTGLGKTHLMQAIAQEILDRHSNANIVYISSEYFTNELIEAIAKKSTARFRAKYRKVDVLLIDDIHFIAGKEATQEEFFHTFNELFDRHRQIVISSDRQPKDIPGLEERLVSRFEWGLVTDIQPPDFETRIAILQSKAQEENHTVPPEVLKYIANYITTNIRELEGALITVLAYSRLERKPITLQLAEEVLRDLIGREKIKPISVEDVLRAVADHFDVRISDLRGRSRQRQVALPRQFAMYLCKSLIPNLSLSEVGDAFGGKDHTTVLYACQKIEKDSRENTETRQVVGQLERMLRG